QIQPFGPGASRAFPGAFAQRRRSAGVSFIATVHGAPSASTVHVVPATCWETPSARATLALSCQSALGPCFTWPQIVNCADVPPGAPVASVAASMVAAPTVVTRSLIVQSSLPTIV